MFENMSAFISTQNSQNFYLFSYFGIGSDSFYFHIKNRGLFYKKRGPFLTTVKDFWGGYFFQNEG